MHLLLHSAIDVAEPIRRRLAACLFDAKAFGQAGLRLAERQAAALGAGIMFRLRVADALLRMFAHEFHAVMLRVTVYGCTLAAMGLIAAEMSRGWQKGLILLLTLALIGVIGLSRVYLGVHYPTDVVAGFALAALILCIARAIIGAKPAAQT